MDILWILVRQNIGNDCSSTLATSTTLPTKNSVLIYSLYSTGKEF